MTETNSNEINDVMQRIERAKQHVVGWKENIKRWRKLYDMQHYDTKGKPNEIQYSDPTYTNTVDLAVGILLANRLRWHAFGFHPSQQEQEETSQIEKLLDGTLMVNNEREEANQLYQLFLNFTRDGGGAIYSVYDPDLANEHKFTKDIPDPEEGSRKVWAFKEIPLRVQVIDPESIIVLPGGPKRWLGIGRIEQRSVLDIETLYGVTLDKITNYTDEHKDTTKTYYVDWWDTKMKPG